MYMIKSIYDAYKYNKNIKNGLKEFKANAKGFSLLNKKADNDRKIHVIVNGPSLMESINQIDDGDDVIAVNFAIKQDCILKLKPKYFVSIDPFSIAEEQNLMYIKHLLDEGIIEKYVTNYKTYNIWKKNFEAENVILLNQTCNELPYDSKRDRKNYEQNYLAPYTQNVAIAALYVALQEGYREIYLHGNDFSFMKTLYVNEENELCRKDMHFYGENEINITKVTGSDLYGELQSQLLALRGYEQVADYARDIAANIYNVSKNSMLDMFSRK